MIRKVLLLPFLCPFLACNSGALDITVTRGSRSFHFTDRGCGVNLTGNTGAGPSAVDIACPATLRAPGGGPTLHISTPLVTKPGAAPLQDPQFREAGTQLGRFVVVRYREGETEVQCDPQMAQGSLLYNTLPQAGSPGRLAGRFSEDAALLNCKVMGMLDTSGPLSLRGMFDVATP